MTTQTPPKPAQHPQPYGPFTPASTPGQETSALRPDDAGVVLDALPLLDYSTRRRTISPGLAPRGHYLAMKDGRETRVLRLDGNVIHVGRGTESAIRLDEYHVSRSHAVLVRHGRHFRILDNRSSNGTFVNGRQIAATNIQNGDLIAIGPVGMQYVVMS